MGCVSHWQGRNQRTQVKPGIARRGLRYGMDGAGSQKGKNSMDGVQQCV